MKFKTDDFNHLLIFLEYYMNLNCYNNRKRSDGDVNNTLSRCEQIHLCILIIDSLCVNGIVFT
jgi:hypothetical protein